MGRLKIGYIRYIDLPAPGGLPSPRTPLYRAISRLIRLNAGERERAQPPLLQVLVTARSGGTDANKEVVVAEKRPAERLQLQSVQGPFLRLGSRNGVTAV